MHTIPVPTATSTEASPASFAGRPVLFVLTSHARKGDSGEPTGFYLAEVTHPLQQLETAGIPVEFASIQGGEPPVDGLDLQDTGEILLSLGVGVGLRLVEMSLPQAAQEGMAPLPAPLSTT